MAVVVVVVVVPWMVAVPKSLFRDIVIKRELSALRNRISYDLSIGLKVQNVWRC